MKNEVKSTYFLSNNMGLFHLSKYCIFSVACLCFGVFVIKSQISAFWELLHFLMRKVGPGGKVMMPAGPVLPPVAPQVCYLLRLAGMLVLVFPFRDGKAGTQIKGLV